MQYSWQAHYFITMWLLTGHLSILPECYQRRDQLPGVRVVLQLNHTKTFLKHPFSICWAWGLSFKMVTKLGRSCPLFTWRPPAMGSPSNWLRAGLGKNCGQSGVGWGLYNLGSRSSREIQQSLKGADITHQKSFGSTGLCYGSCHNFIPQASYFSQQAFLYPKYFSLGPAKDGRSSRVIGKISQWTSFQGLSSHAWNLESPVQFSCSVMSNSLWPHGLQHARPPCPSPTPGVYSNSCPLSRWCHPTTSSSVVPFSSCPQSWMGYYNCSFGKMKQLSSLWEGLEIKFHTLFWKFFPQVGKMLACLNLDLYEKWVSSK